MKFSKVADIEKGGFTNLEINDLEFKESKIIVKRSTNLVSDVLYFTRDNQYETKSSNSFSFFGNDSIIVEPYISDGQYSNSICEMKFDLIELVTFKDGFYTYDLKQKIVVETSSRKYIYKVKKIYLITNMEVAYLIYPNGMGRIYKK
ncbi:hypothetical protein [Polaribacter sp. ALD11]|uniref:hypothetical protein n=1 Tax=Polaribacter sp. ALD11 TaxID=2058137 RepID=UPI0012FD6E43|nr:hypothetical protein [Polaribacter sp. ALD11]